MPIYEHQCEKCEYIWEDLFSSYKSPPPEECPNCGEKGCIKRVPSWCAGKVELVGRERIAAMKSEGRKIAAEARNNENLRANLIGEEKYNKQCTKR
jgi:putative FmdB family regulatory protein